MTEKQYNEAIKERQIIKKRLIELDKNILTYENEHPQKFYLIEDVIDFVMEAELGAMFEYCDVLYQVCDTYDNVVREYGWEHVSDSMYNTKTIEELSEYIIKITK